MEVVTMFLLALLFFVMWLCYKQTLMRKENYGATIPGPTGWKSWKEFLCGAKNNNLHMFAWDCAERYGDIVKVTLGGQSTIFLNNARMVRELFNGVETKAITNDRPPSFIGKYILFDQHNTVFTHRTPVQKEKRKIFHSVMKFYGENVCRIEGIILDILDKLKQELECGEEVEMSKKCSETILKVIHVLFTGSSYPMLDSHMKAFNHFNRKWEDFFVFEVEAALQPFPWLRLIPGLPFKPKCENLEIARDELLDVYFNDLKSTYVEGEERGMIDNLLTAQKEGENVEGKYRMSDQTIKASICETTAASYQSSSNITSILILVLMYKKDIQDKMAYDIGQVIEPGESPKLKHRSRLPYIEAAIIETLRFTTFSPFLVPHYTQKDISFEGLHIPKNSVLVINAWYIHRREDIWEDAWNFKPERFIDEQGELLPSDHPIRRNMVAFGAGSRICPGEQFSKSRLFLIVTYLLKNFEFYPLEGVDLPSMDPRDWPNGYVIKAPQWFKCGVRKRQ